MSLFDPDIPALVEKWKAVLDVVLPKNLYDTPCEIAWLCEAVQGVDNLLELGSHRGISTKAMLLANPNAFIRCVDLWEQPGTKDEFTEFLSDEISARRVSVIHGSTADGLRLLRSEGHRYGFAFIDAGHTAELVRSDIEGVLPLLLPGALLCGHDYRVDLPDDGVTKTVREMLPSHVVVTDSIWAVRA